MQYWIFYWPGVGGDGFACLLEHANNIKPADGEIAWRIHHYNDKQDEIDRPIRFYQAAWTTRPLPFRTWWKGYDISSLNPIYVDLIHNKQNTVITAHFDYWQLIDKFSYKSLVETDQVKIHLYSERSQRVWHDLRIKRGTPMSLDEFAALHSSINERELSRSDYEIHIDIEQIWRNWDYMQDCMNRLRIDLSKDVYDHYLTFIRDL